MTTHHACAIVWLCASPSKKAESKQQHSWLESYIHTYRGLSAFAQVPEKRSRKKHAANKAMQPPTPPTQHTCADQRVRPYLAIAVKLLQHPLPQPLDDPLPHIKAGSKINHTRECGAVLEAHTHRATSRDRLVREGWCTCCGSSSRGSSVNVAALLVRSSSLSMWQEEPRVTEEMEGRRGLENTTALLPPWRLLNTAVSTTYTHASTHPYNPVTLCGTHLLCVTACVQQDVSRALAVAKHCDHLTAQLLLQMQFGTAQLLCF